MPEEIGPILKMSQSLYWEVSLNSGTIIQKQDIVAKSPGHPGGIYPIQSIVDRFVQQRLTRAVKQDDLVSWEDLA